MNWGYKIAFIYGAFVLMIIFFLVVASKQTNEMVEDHYYEKEIKFQEVLQASQNLSEQSNQPDITIINSEVHIAIPAMQISELKDIKIKFIRLSDKSMDIHLAFNKIDQNEIVIPANKFYKGIYQLQIDWIYNKIPYHYQGTFNYSKA